LAAFVAFLKLEPFDFESAEVVEKDDTWGGGGGGGGGGGTKVRGRGEKHNESAAFLFE